MSTPFEAIRLLTSTSGDQFRALVYLSHTDIHRLIDRVLRAKRILIENTDFSAIRLDDSPACLIVPAVSALEGRDLCIDAEAPPAYISESDARLDYQSACEDLENSGTALLSVALGAVLPPEPYVLRPANLTSQGVEASADLGAEASGKLFRDGRPSRLSTRYLRYADLLAASFAIEEPGEYNALMMRLIETDRVLALSVLENGLTVHGKGGGHLDILPHIRIATLQSFIQDADHEIRVRGRLLLGRHAEFDKTRSPIADENGRITR